jgi:hypothetical protein
VKLFSLQICFTGLRRGLSDIAAIKLHILSGRDNKRIWLTKTILPGGEIDNLKKRSQFPESGHARI